MVSDAAKKRLAAKKAAKDGKLQGSAKPSPAVSQSPVSLQQKDRHMLLYFLLSKVELIDRFMYCAFRFCDIWMLP